MKKIILLLFCIVYGFTLSAQEAKTLFVNMPDSITPLLTAVNRADFIDFLESNMKAVVKNKFDDNSEMTVLTDSYININMSDESTWQMKLLPTDNNSVIISVITSACGPVCDSKIRFFNTDWTELPAPDYIDLPTEDAFYNKPTDADQLFSYNQLREIADIYMYKAEFLADVPTVTFTYTTPEYLNEADREKLSAFLTSPIVYTWQGNKFVRSN